MAQIHRRSRIMLGCGASPLMNRWWRARKEKGGWKRVQGRALGRVLQGVACLREIPKSQVNLNENRSNFALQAH